MVRTRSLPTPYQAMCRCRPAIRELVDGPLLVLVWGLALGAMLWGSGVDVALQVWLFHNAFDGEGQHFNTAMRMLGSVGKGSMQVSLCVLFCIAWAVNGWLKGAINIKGVRHVLMAVPVFTLAGIINWTLKWSIGRGRPKEFLWNNADPYRMNSFEMTAQWWSFPSGHTCSTFAIAVWLGFLFPRLKYVFWAIATVLSFSRFLAVTPHYFGDVVTGAAVGSSTAWAMWILGRVWIEGKHV